MDQKYTVWALHGENPSKKSIECLPVEQEENMEEENLESRGLGLENLVDAFYGIQDEHPLDTVSVQMGVVEEPYVGNDKYSEYKRLATEKLYPLCEVLRQLFLQLWN